MIKPLCKQLSKFAFKHELVPENAWAIFDTNTAMNNILNTENIELL